MDQGTVNAMENPCRSLRSGQGFVLITCVMLLALLAVLGATATTTTTVELQVAGNERFQKMAFYQADAGIQYALARMEAGLADGTFTLPTTNAAFDSFCNPAPSGFTFTLEARSMQGPGLFSCRSTGSGPRNARAVIEASFTRPLRPAITCAAFGDVLVDIRSNGAVYSYDHTVVSTPSPSDSTGEGDVISNQEVSLKNNTLVDGDVALGDDGAGNEGWLTVTGTPTITGDAGTDVDRLNPDPLGVIGGEYAALFSTYAIHNDNADAGLGPVLDLSDPLTLPGKPGGAHYYFTAITLRNGAVLNIDATAGPVHIFLAGPLEAKNGSAINNTFEPTDFAIFSNAADNLVFKHGSDFKGLLYAPYAQVEMKNSADIYGAIWAQTVFAHNSGELYYDTRLQHLFQYPGNDLVLVAWKDLSG